jgi:hypothetical protein
LTGHQIKFVDYWSLDGLWADRLLTLESPRSVETETIAARGVYISYIPGGTLQLYLLHRLLPDLPLPLLVSLYGLAIQILVALMCGVLTFNMIDRADRAGPAVLFVLSAMLTYLFQPVPYYFHPMVQFGYQWVLLPFAIACYLEYRLRTQGGRGLLWASAAVAGWMAATDWMFIPFCLALTLFRFVSPLPAVREKRWARGAVETLLQIWTLPAIVCVAYLGNLYANGLVGSLISRAKERTGMSGEPVTLLMIYNRIFVETLGSTSVWLLAATLASVGYLVRDRRDAGAVVSCVSLLTCFLYVALLPNDSYTHDFSTLKFYVPLSFVAFGVMPYRLIWQLWGRLRLAALSAIMGLWSFYLVDWHSIWPYWFHDRPPATQKLAEWLRAHAIYDEVYVSDGLDITDNPPVALAISRKRVWRFDTPELMRAFLGRLPPAAQPRLVSKVDYSACFGGSPVRLSDGTFNFATQDWSDDRWKCIADKWPSPPSSTRPR